MAAIVWSDVVAVAKEMADPKVDPVAQAMLLDWANTSLKVRLFTGGEASQTLKLARCLKVAHVATLTTAGGSAKAGPVVSESEGGLSRSYAMISAITGGSDPDYGSTSYGQAYMAIINGLAGARLPFVPGQGDSLP